MNLALLSIGGIAAIVSVIIQLGKPALIAWLGDGDEEVAKVDKWYKPLVHLIALFLGVSLAIAMQLAIDANYGSMLDAIIMGVLGAASSVGLYEGTSGVRKVVNGKQS